MEIIAGHWSPRRQSCSESPLPIFRCPFLHRQPLRTRPAPPLVHPGVPSPSPPLAQQQTTSTNMDWSIRTFGSQVRMMQTNSH